MAPKIEKQAAVKARRKAKRERFWHGPVYYLLYALAWLAGILPIRWARGLGRALGRLGMRLVGSRRQAARQALALSFPDKSHQWREEVLRGCFENLGQVAMESLRLLRMDGQDILAMTRHHGLERARQVADDGKGVIFITCHMGNWELEGLAVGLAATPYTAVGRPLDFPPADRLVRGWRGKCGNRVVPKARSFRPLLRELKAGRAIAVLGDQNVDWYDGVWVDFFGRPACSNKGIALLALASKSPVIPVYCARAADGLFDIYYGEAIPLVDTGDRTGDVWWNTYNYTKAYEKMIRSHPEQWLWVHKRWKTKPFRTWPRREDS